MNNISDLIRPAAEQMMAHLEAEMKAALDHVAPGWTLLDAKKRCRLERVRGIPFETFFLDDKPLLEIYPVESSVEVLADRTVVRYTRKVRHL